ncbi:hypothetical protein Q8A73_020966 [Channa argus]|nr:hypothetical protein Q8A73_020966 [Channa argus]
MKETVIDPRGTSLRLSNMDSSLTCVPMGTLPPKTGRLIHEPSTDCISSRGRVHEAVSTSDEFGSFASFSFTPWKTEVAERSVALVLPPFSTVTQAGDIDVLVKRRDRRSYSRDIIVPHQRSSNGARCDAHCCTVAATGGVFVRATAAQEGERGSGRQPGYHTVKESAFWGVHCPPSPARLPPTPGMASLARSTGALTTADAYIPLKETRVRHQHHTERCLVVRSQLQLCADGKLSAEVALHLPASCCLTRFYHCILAASHTGPAGGARARRGIMKTLEWIKGGIAAGLVLSALAEAKKNVNVEKSNEEERDKKGFWHSDVSQLVTKPMFQL